MQRARLVDSEEKSENSDDFNVLFSKNKSKQSIAAVRAELTKYCAQDNLSEIDKVLLKGFYTNRRDELDKPRLIPSIETSDSEYIHNSQVQVDLYTGNGPDEQGKAMIDTHLRTEIITPHEDACIIQEERCDIESKAEPMLVIQGVLALSNFDVEADKQ